LEDVDLVVAGSAVDYDAAQAACDIAVFVFRVHDVAMDPARHHKGQDFLLEVTLALASRTGNEKHAVGDLVIPLEDIGIHRAAAIGAAQGHAVGVNQAGVTERIQGCHGFTGQIVGTQDKVVAAQRLHGGKTIALFIVQLVIGNADACKLNLYLLLQVRQVLQRLAVNLDIDVDAVNGILVPGDFGIKVLDIHGLL